MTYPLRIQVASDFHRDVDLSDIHLASDADVIVVAGDVCEGIGGTLRYLRGRVPESTPIVFVAGNHEFYRRTVDAELERGREVASDLGIAFLENDAAVIGGVRFLGCTLWTDYALNGEAWREQSMLTAWSGMNDHRLITQSKKPWQRFEPQHALARHRASRAWLEKEAAEPFGGPTVIVTHHAPSRRSVHPKYAGQIINAAFASDLDGFVANSGATLWIHGHTHSSFDYRLGNTRVLCNPHGYGPENRDFDPALIVEIPRP